VDEFVVGIGGLILRRANISVWRAPLGRKPECRKI